MKRKWFLGILGFFLVLSCAGGAWSDESKGVYTIMQPDRATRLKWIADYERASLAHIDSALNFRRPLRGSLSLLSRLQYTPSERDQASCGNCWAWAGTGVMGIALNVQEALSDRLSVQFISSCNTEKECCDGGWLNDFADYYASEGLIIPWSNTNASWQNGDGKCNVPCSSISISPRYGIESIAAETIETQGVDQAQAISNIKNVLNQNRAVWFAWYLATKDDWDNFRSFWHNQGESVTTNLDYGCGHEWESQQGGGHAVLCVGYNDDDPDNAYWIMLNSWGTAGGGRPNGIFRLDMDMDYDCTFYDGQSYRSYFWQTLDVRFRMDEDLFYVESSGLCDGKRPCYATIQGAVDDVQGADATILVAGGIYKDVSLSTPVKATFRGGYDATFTTRSSTTILNRLTVRDGCAVVDKVVLGEKTPEPNITYSGSDPYDYGKVHPGAIRGRSALTRTPRIRRPSISR